MAHHTPIAQLTKPAHLPLLGTLVAAVDEPDREGKYASFIGVFKRDGMPLERAFSTNRVYFNDDHDNWGAESGHYDMALEEALVDMHKRTGK